MKYDNIDYSIYLVTDRQLISTETLEQAVEKSIIGGCTIVQLREKDISSLEFYNTGLKIKEITDRYNIPLIINDRIDIAMSVDADGVHLGQSDIPADIARKLIGNKKIMGVSVSSVEEALKAEKDGADYIGVGAMYSTNTKTDAEIVSIDELIRIRNSVKIPIVVIGGINKDTIYDFKGIKIDGIAVVSAILSQKDISNAAKELKQIFLNLKGI